MTHKVVINENNKVMRKGLHRRRKRSNKSAVMMLFAKQTQDLMQLAFFYLLETDNKQQVK